MSKRFFIVALCSLVALFTYAQEFQVQGIILDAKDNTPLAWATVLAVRSSDSLKIGASSDADGRFILRGVRPGTYLLNTTYLGYLSGEKPFTVDTRDLDLGKVFMAQNANVLKEVLVRESQIRVQQLGDTTQYNADAYKTNRDANVEDLVTKMPGITLENGVLKVQGEDLKKVTIDGEDFFGEDATLALKNLPAEIVDKIQVFDRLSEQAQFTGFDDGNTQKTLNIVTKSGKSNGQFGKVYAGYGSDDRYIGGANLNYFKGKQRISLIGLSNNINQQNFSSQDLLGITNSGGGGRGSGGGGRGQGGAANNFLTGQQAGISQVNSIGLNYSNRWGEKIKLNGAYFFNNNQNTNISELSREYFLDQRDNQFYDENSRSTSDNFNHRVSMRLDYTIDKKNSITLRPNLSFQDNKRRSSFIGNNFIAINDPLSSVVNDTRGNNNGYSFSNDLLYRHRFEKAGRSISLNVGTSLNDKSGDNYLLSYNQYFRGVDTSEVLNQLALSQSSGFTVSPNLVYTEPVGKNGQLQLNYSPSFNRSDSDRETNSLDSLTGDYTRPDLLLSNQFDNEVQTQKAGTSYRFRKEKVNFSIGLNYQNLRLSSTQAFPTAFMVDKTFQNLLPDASFNYRPSKNENFRVQYRTSTAVPKINQLQNVINNNNPLLLSTGNPELKQSFGHSFNLRYNRSNPSKANSFFVFGTVGLSDNYIGNMTQIAQRDTVVQGNIPLLAGSQLTQPVNLQGFWNTRAFSTYGLPIKVIKSNLNLNAGFSYQRAPSLINGTKNLVHTYTTSGGLVLGSNISEKLDFTLSYNANYNKVNNSLQANLNNNYFYQNTGVKLNWEFVKRLTLSSDLTQNLYTGLGEGFNQQFLLWNATIGYRMLKNEALEIRLGVFDLLKQNNSIVRNVTETFIEDQISNVLQRYVMVSAVYSIRNFGG